MLAVAVSEVKERPVFKTHYKVEHYLYHSSLHFFFLTGKQTGETGAQKYPWPDFFM